MKGALTEIVQLATLDSDPWVLMVADILKSFPDTGSLNLDLEEQNPNVQDILGELREKGKPFLLVRITEICLFSGITCCFSCSLSILTELVSGQAACLVSTATVHDLACYWTGNCDILEMVTS